MKWGWCATITAITFILIHMSASYIKILLGNGWIGTILMAVIILASVGVCLFLYCSLEESVNKRVIGGVLVSWGCMIVFLIDYIKLIISDGTLVKTILMIIACIIVIYFIAAITEKDGR